MASNLHFSKITEWAARWYVFVFINVYGFGKIIGGQFHRHGHLPDAIAKQTVGELSGFDLAWTFFGYSPIYIVFIGLLQILGGFLLLWERSKLLGVSILTPILLNIIVIDAIYDVPGAIISAIFYFLLLLLIVYFNRERVTRAIRALTERGRVKQKRSIRSSAILAGAVMGVLAVLFFLETLLLKTDGFSRL